MMEKLAPVFCLIVLLPCLLGMGSTRKDLETGPSLRGIAVSVYVHQSKDEIRKALDEVKELGANAVLLKVSEIQEFVESTVIRPEPTKTLPLQSLRFALNEAKARGFEVLLMPIVLIEKPRKRTDWRGAIRPTDREDWFESYTRMILKYARIASETEVDIFSVGSELASMEKYQGIWSDLIGHVREIYKGKLLYSANWDHLVLGKAWRELDYLGLTGYFELAEKKENPTLPDLEEAWDQIIPSVEAWSEALQKKLILTEIGYPSREDALFDPWDHTRKGRVNEELQRKGFQAVVNAWSKSKRLKGLLFYEWYGVGGKEDSGYTPRGKKAESVLRKFFEKN